MTNDVKVPAEVAVDELAAEAKTPEDQALVAQWRQEVAGERAEALASMSKPKEAVVDVAGAVATQHEVEAMQAAGQDMASGAYENGRRA